MTQNRTWQEYSSEEKLLVIESYLEGVAKLDSSDREVQNKHLEWLREHLPAYRESDRNYLFVSYSHIDYREVYHDLAFFSYNSETHLRFWYDEGLPAGEDWAAAAKARLDDPRCVGVIFYLSENLLKSAAVRQEIALLKASGKAFVTVALEEGKYSARAILGEDHPLLSELSDTFPDENTVLSFRRDYENKLYRIHKIESVFNVTENVMSDFVCTEVEDGLSLTSYLGKNTEIHIPERIGDKNVVEITAEFPSATRLFLPKTIKRILPHPIDEDLYEDLESEDTATIFRMTEASIGGFAKVWRPFGSCPQLEAIYVDNENPDFFDRDGVLYSSLFTLVRFPPNRADTEGVFENVIVIGQGAFADCRYNLEFNLPDSILMIEDGAFDNTNFFCTEYPKSLLSIGASCFNEANANLVIDMPQSLASIGDFAFRGLKCVESLFIGFLFGGVKIIPRGACFGSAIRDILFLADPPTHIGRGAFALCHNLRDITLIEGITTIEDRAFMGCDHMTSITLPKSLTYVGEDVFYGCDSLKLIRYMGSTLQFLMLYAQNPFLDEEMLKLVVCNDRPLKRLAAHRLMKRVQKARKLLNDD